MIKLFLSLMLAWGALLLSGQNPMAPDFARHDPQGVDTYVINAKAGVVAPGEGTMSSMADAGADITASLTVLPNVAAGITRFNLVVRIIELSQTGTEGEIRVVIPRDSHWFFAWDSGLTEVGGMTVRNAVWNYDGNDPANHVFTTWAGIAGGGVLPFGLLAVFDPQNSRGSSTITTQIVTGNGVDTNGGNNADSEKIDYFARAASGSTTVGCSISGSDLVSPGATTEFCAPEGMAGYRWSVSGATISGSADGRCVQVQPMGDLCGLMVLLTTVDGSGNQASCYKEVKVEDQAPPVAGYCPEPVDLGCNPGVEDYQPTLNLQWSDHCGIETTGVRAGTPEADANVNGGWNMTHIYYAIDYSGNEGTCSQVLTWQDCLAVTTAVADSVTANSVILGGEVTHEGTSAVTERGVCYGTTQTPTTESAVKVAMGSGTGLFSGKITGLATYTTYYAKAYAINSQGTAYGDEVSFVAANPTGTFIDSRDGNVYDWVKIGDQVWMAQNLVYLPTVSGPLARSYTAPYYYVYDYDGADVNAAKATTNYSTYGVLYNWPAALTACPAGWHLPSDAEWKQLEMALGMTQDQADRTGYRRTDQGTQMKSTSGWLDNGNGTNTSGFSGLPGGALISYGNFILNGYNSLWWSSTEDSASYAWRRQLNCDYAYVDRYYNVKELGFSVRCLRDF